MDRNGGEDETCNTELRLSIGTGNFTTKANKDNKPKVVMNSFGLSLPLDMNSSGENTHYLDQDRDESQDEDDVVGLGEKRNRASINGRKKLRLTRDQLCLLEETFKIQHTLNTAQKQALAERLNLQARQIEVWFQNRRARTKLKQTEVDCDFLKKCCERLNAENQRLRKEVQDLRAAWSSRHGVLYNTATTSSSSQLPIVVARCDKHVKARQN